MKNIIYICALLFSFNAFAQSIITKKLGDFTTLKVYNGIEVELKMLLPIIESSKSEIVKVACTSTTL